MGVIPDATLRGWTIRSRSFVARNETDRGPVSFLEGVWQAYSCFV